MTADGPRYAVRDPRGTPRAVQHSALAARLPDLRGRTVCLLISMPHGSGMEPLANAVAAALQRRFEGLRILRANRGSGYMGDDPAQREAIAAEADAVLYFGNPTGALTTAGFRYAAALERAGVPAALVIFDTLVPVAQRARETLGVALRAVVVPYPLPPLDDAAVQSAIQATIDALTLPCTRAELRADLVPAPGRDLIAFTGNWDAVQAHFQAQGWSDGLPIVPPTQQAVARMLTGTSHAAHTPVTQAMPPENLGVTVEQVAIVAVMAGADPACLPVLLALVEAFAAGGPDTLQVRSTNSFCFMQLVNGPVRHEIGMNGGLNALGPGNKANAVLGRALNLFVRTLGGGETGVNMMAVQGNAAGHGFAFCENEERSPWPPFAASQGFGAGDSTLSLFNGGWSHAGNYLFDGLEQLARAMARFELPTGAVVIMSPARAQALAAEGLDKAQAEQRLWSAATLALGEFRASGYFPGLITARIQSAGIWPADYLTRDDADMVPVFPRGSIRIVVAGGEIAPMMQGWRMAHQATVSIDRWR